MSEYYTIVNKSVSKYGEGADFVSTIIAPLTAQYTEIMPVTSSDRAKLAAAAATRITLPLEYDPRATGELLHNKTSVLDQASCGSCWAFSTATAMADTFSRISDSQVFIDPMSVILGAQADPSLTKQICKQAGAAMSLGNGCGGAAPLQVAMCLGGYTGPEVALCNCSQWSLTGPTCQDYSSYLSACQGNSKCAVLPSKTRSKQLNKAFIDLNTTTDKGFKNGGVQGLCFQKPAKGKHFEQFRLTMPDNTWFSTVLQGYKAGQPPLPDQKGAIYNAIKVNQERMKELIQTNGTLVGGMPVFMDFMSGGKEGQERHSSNETITLTTSSWLDAEHGKIYVGGGCTDPTTVDGGHAVCIVGWGHSPKLKTYVENKLPWMTQDVIKAVNDADGDNGNFWIMRNSWGKIWGDDGYWLSAVYPGNLYAQFSNTYILPPTVWSTQHPPSSEHLNIVKTNTPLPTIFGGQWAALQADTRHPKQALGTVDTKKYKDMIANITQHPPSSLANSVGSLIGEKLATQGMLGATQGETTLTLANKIYQNPTPPTFHTSPVSPGSPGPPDSQNTSHTVLIIVIVLVVLFISLGVGYFLWRNSK